MPKQSPIPEAVDQPFFDACNEDRLVIQHCTNCDRLQHPPKEVCSQCGSADYLEWSEMSGRGSIYSYSVIYDSPVAVLQEDQPFNCAIVTLEEDPDIQMLSHLPGTPVDDVPIGAKVEVMFEVTPATGQKVAEWRVVS